MGATVIQKVLIDFVGKHEHVVSLRYHGNTLQLLPAEHFPGRIAGRIHNDRLGSRRDRALDLVHGKNPVGRPHLHPHRHRLNRQQCVDVILIVGLEKNNLVAGIEQPQASTMKGAGGSRADCYVRFRISHDAVVLRKLLGHRLPQFWQSIESRVDILPAVYRLCRGSKHHRWSRRVADPLRHVETLRLNAGVSHCSNLRVGQGGHSLVEISVHRRMTHHAVRLSCRRPIQDWSSLLSTLAQSGKSDDPSPSLLRPGTLPLG